MIVDAFAQQNISYITNEQLQETVASVFIFFADIKHTIITQSEARTVNIRSLFLNKKKKKNSFSMISSFQSFKYFKNPTKDH
jgi:hypothetical protein